MKARQSSRFLVHSAIVAVALFSVCDIRCDAAEPIAIDNRGPVPAAPQGDVRWGGVLQESFGYHRKVDANAAVKHPAITPPGGWYGYGFPVKTYRWGWFGAEHYYPRVLWHRGYNGDHWRWSYRRGY